MNSSVVDDGDYASPQRVVDSGGGYLPGDYIVPDLPGFEASADLGNVLGRPVRLRQGEVRAADPKNLHTGGKEYKRGYGLVHIHDARGRQLIPDYVPGDPAENITRFAYFMANSFDRAFEDAGRLVLWSRDKKAGMVLQEAGPKDDRFLSVVSIVPMDIPRGKAVGNARSQAFDEAQLFGAPSSPAPDTSLPGTLAALGNRTAKVILNERGELVNAPAPGPKVETRKRRRIVAPGDADRASPPRRNAFPTGFDIPEDSALSGAWRTLVFKFQDVFDSLEVVQKAAGGALPEDQDAYLAETVYRGRVGALIEDFNADHVKPILDIMHKHGLDIAEVDRYLQGRHVHLDKVNAYLASINLERATEGQDVSALSGMTDAEAADIMANETPALKEIGRRVDEITKMRRELLVDSGLETQSTVDAWENAYQHYVPLHRDEEGETNLPRKGKGFDTRGKEKRRAGSKRKVTNVLAHIMAQHEATIIRAEKAEVARALLNFVENHPNPDLWEVNPVDYAPRFDADGMVSFAPDPSYALADNVLAVRVDGQDYHIRFNTQNTHAARIVFAMKNLGAQESGVLVNQLGKLNRWLAMVNTSLNPEFTVVNFLRDVQTAGYNLSNTEVDNLKWAILKDIGKAARGIHSAELGKGNHAWSQYYREFRDAGGKTGWLQSYENIDDRRADLERQLKMMRPGAGRSVARGLRAVVEFVEKENTVIENAVRLSAFVHARKAGLSTAKAAALAKELTVNFNRKGEYGPMLNSLYLFYNAAIQGTARIFMAMARSQKARILAGATVAFASALDILNRALSDDDDDGVPFYDKIPNHIKDRNLIIMLPDTGGEYLKIALPWGYNVLHVMGQEMAAAAMQKGYDPGKSALRVLVATLEAFNPVSVGGSWTQWVAPTALDPVAMVGENKAWTGRPLFPEDKFAEYETPDAYKFWPSAREGSKWVAAQLNEITGGDKYEKGAVDISPETIDLYLDMATGGMGRFLMDSVSTPWKAATEGSDAVELRTVPFLRKVYGEPESSRARMQYFERRQELKMIEDKLAAAEDDPVALDRLDAKHKGRVMLIEDGTLEAADAQIKLLRKEKKALQAEGSDAATKAEIKAIDAMIQSVQMDFNRAYNEATQ